MTRVFGRTGGRDKPRTRCGCGVWCRAGQVRSYARRASLIACFSVDSFVRNPDADAVLPVTCGEPPGVRRGSRQLLVGRERQPQVDEPVDGVHVCEPAEV